MHVAWCGPISLWPLKSHLREGTDVPEGYVYPLGAYFVEELLKAGHRVTVVTTTSDSDAGRQEFRGEQLGVVVVPRRKPREFVRDLFRVEVRMMAAELARSRPDVVHAQWTYEFADAALRSRLPTVVTARDAAPAIFWHVRDKYRFVRLLYSYWVIPRIRHLSVSSPYLSTQYRNWYVRRRTDLVPNGLRDGYFGDGRVRARTTRNVVVAITGWDGRKNTKTLLEGFARAREEVADLRLIVMGGDLEPGGKGARWAAANNLAHGVDFRGRVTHDEAMAVLRNEGEIFVHATLEESFCMAVVEAMAAGVPVVAGKRSGAVPWVLGEGRFGALVDVRSPAAVAAGILELARNPARATETARAAWQFARENFSMSRTVAAYGKIYERIIRSATPRGESR